MEDQACVYIMASQRNGTLYLGSAANLAKRVWEHRNGVGGKFTQQYGCKLLVWYELIGSWEAARQRELHMKEWKRAWKLREIEGMNPDWDDLLRFDRAAMSGSQLGPGLRRGGITMETQ